jgi:hypothetical protein
MTSRAPYKGQVHPNNFGSAGSLANTVGMILPVTGVSMSGAVFHEAELSDTSGLSAEALLAQYLPSNGGSSSAVAMASAMMEDVSASPTPSPAAVAKLSEFVIKEKAMLAERQSTLNTMAENGADPEVIEKNSDLLSADTLSLEQLGNKLDDLLEGHPELKTLKNLVLKGMNIHELANIIRNNDFGIVGLLGAMQAGSDLTKLARSLLEVLQSKAE